jgi:FixJ family two-component response regulator
VADAIRLALIDDDAAVCDSLQLYFARHSVSVTCFHAADQYLKAVSASELFDCVVTDVRMPGISGLDLVRQVAARGSSCPIILITGHGDVDMAVSAVKSGAFDRSTSAACSRASAMPWRRTVAMSSMRPSSPACRPVSSSSRRGSAR